MLVGKQKRRFITLERVEDNHQFTVRCDHFCLQGSRPPEKLVYQLGVIRNCDFTLVNESDGQLGQGSREYIKLVRTRDGHQFTARCDSFCLQGKRPPDKLVYQLDVIRNGDFTLVNEEDGQLGQGSKKDIKLVRTRDGHPFTMRCETFCLEGSRPPEKLVYQLEVIRNGDFTMVNEEDGQLGQGSGKHIKLVRTRDQKPVSIRCDTFCSGVCFHCLITSSSCNFAPNTCASCWCIKFPGAALSVHPNAGRQTEIMVAAMLNAHLGHVHKEYMTRDNKREDVVLMSTKLAVAIDGIHHFADHQYTENGKVMYCAEMQLVDTNKCRWWFKDYPGSSYVRMVQDTSWRGYPVNTLKPISFDFVSAINYIDHHPELYGGKVVFLEKMDKATAYAEHRRLLDVERIGHVTLDPRTIEYGPYRIVEDKRAILSQ